MSPPRARDAVRGALPRSVAITSMLGLSLALWAFWFEPRRLVVHEATLHIPHWPAAQRGLRVALLSDLHVGSPFWTLERLRELVAATNREQPELVLLAGDDLINGVKLGTWVDPASIARVLGELRAPLGVVAVLGNHDWYNDGHRVRRALVSAGIVVLENEAHAVTRAAGRCWRNIRTAARCGCHSSVVWWCRPGAVSVMRRGTWSSPGATCSSRRA